ncbi:hypothetical protein ACTXT7_017492, partial [Hymenolepis weldensis]
MITKLHCDDIYDGENGRDTWFRNQKQLRPGGSLTFEQPVVPDVVQRREGNDQDIIPMWHQHSMAFSS